MTHKSKLKTAMWRGWFSYALTQPPVFGFLISLFLIAISLAALGMFVRGREHMPDLEAMQVSTSTLNNALYGTTLCE